MTRWIYNHQLATVVIILGAGLAWDYLAGRRKRRRHAEMQALHFDEWEREIADHEEEEGTWR